MIHALSLIASAVAAFGHLLIAFAANNSGRAGGAGGAGSGVPRAFARVGFALAAWSAAVFLDDLLEDVGLQWPWIVALAIPPYGLALAARVHGSAPRLDRFAVVAWILGGLTAVPLALIGPPAVPWAALVLYPCLAFALGALRWAHAAHGKSAHGFVLAASLTVAASLVDTIHVFGGPRFAAIAGVPRLAALASLVMVAQLGSSVARHRLFELKPILGRAAILMLVALGVAEALAEALDRVPAPWPRRLLVGLVLLVFALLQRPLLRSLRSPAQRARARRRKEFLRQLERLDEVLARATTLRELEHGLLAALARAPEVAGVRLDLRRGKQRSRAAHGELALPLRAGKRRRGTLFLALREPALVRPRSMRRALHSLASRVAIAASALRLLEERGRTERLAHLGALAAGLAHEIKNPLGAMLGALALLEGPAGGASASPLPPEEQRRWLAVLQEEAQRLDRTVTDALALGRAPKLEMKRAAPRAVAASAQLLAEPKARMGCVELSFRSDEAGAREIELDPDQIRHALLNLLLNAIVVQPQGGRAELAVERRGETVAFHVRDNGPGIAEELRVKVFEPFFTTRPTGSGIGLAVVQRVAAAHGGRLAIAAPDAGFHGAHFVLTIPAEDHGAQDGA